jgi:hypothetical protein
LPVVDGAKRRQGKQRGDWPKRSELDRAVGVARSYGRRKIDDRGLREAIGGLNLNGFSPKTALPPGRLAFCWPALITWQYRSNGDIHAVAKIP